MKLSFEWLKDYLECDLTVQQIADLMTAVGIEVDAVEEQDRVPGGLRGVVVAKVLECEAHPDSDHLHITRVDAGSGEPLTVVCGAPNVAAGQKVLLATIGTELPGDFKIKKSKIRGVESFGMICAEDELGIGTSHEGIMVLPEDAVVGTPAAEYLGLGTQAVIEYEITANRVDAASHWGVARDIYAALKLKGVPCKLDRPSVEAFKEGPGKGLGIDVQDPSAAPRYSGVTVKGVKVGPSPKWLAERLESIGLKPINNIVDISNFVLFELGQPLHTFDADKVRGGTVIVRRASQGEVLKTLDGVERKLDATDIVIADAEGPMCIAGVFGGEDSGVSDDTTSVFIESAYFDPGSIRRTSKRHILQTDASFRFERGADPEVMPYALRRAALLIQECAGGSIEGAVEEFYPEPVKPREVQLDYARIDAFVGEKLGRETIETILEALGYGFIARDDKGATVTVPSYMVDVYMECDVVEEILRIYGYDNIPLPHHMKMSVGATPSPDPEAVRNSISNFLAAQGFNEIMNNSLTKAAYYDSLQTFPAERCVRIVNPLSSDLSVMRQTLILGGLEVVAYNINRQNYSLRTFEYGSVYSRLPEGDGKTLSGYEEHTCFTLMMTGSQEKYWKGAAMKSDFYMLKGYLELLVKRYGADLYQMWTEPAPSDIFSEGTIYKLPGQGNVLATMGTVKPALAARFGVKQPVFAAEIEWKTLFELVRRDKVSFHDIPRYPEVRRDLALLLDESVSYSALRAAAFKNAKKLLRDMTLFDVYRGDKIPEGKKQYAVSLVIRDDDKTLTDEDVERLVGRLLDVFKGEFKADLR